MKRTYIRPKSLSIELTAESMLAGSPASANKVNVSENEADEILSNQRENSFGIWK